MQIGLPTFLQTVSVIPIVIYLTCVLLMEYLIEFYILLSPNNVIVDILLYAYIACAFKILKIVKSATFVITENFYFKLCKFIGKSNVMVFIYIYYWDIKWSFQIMLIILLPNFLSFQSVFCGNFLCITDLYVIYHLCNARNPLGKSHEIL